MTFLAIFSIILIIIENQLTFNCLDNNDTKASWYIKLIISFSTILLIVLILYYHHLYMKLYSYRNLLNDWRLLLTFTKIFRILVEILICLIYPVPRSYPFIDRQKLDSNSINYSLSYIVIDVALSLPSK